MTGLVALTKKELKEQVRTYKLLIVAGVFLLFGIATPLMFNYLPELLALSGEAIDFELPTFTAVQVLGEYVGTLSQLGILVVILIGMGAIARERERGTAAMVLCKPVGRGSFIIAKLLGLSATSLVSLALAGSACYVYTSFLFGEVNGSAFLVLHLLLGLFFVTCLSVILLSSSIFKSQLAAGGMALGVLIGQGLISGIPGIGAYTPNKLVIWGTDLLSGPASSSWPAVAVSLGIIVACLLSSWLILRRKEL